MSVEKKLSLNAAITKKEFDVANGKVEVYYLTLKNVPLYGDVEIKIGQLKDIEKKLLDQYVEWKCV